VLSSDMDGTRVPDDWYVGFHQGLAAEFWRAAGAAMADADAAVLERLLGDAGRVLDVPCGDGRLTRRLAAAGRTAIGVDLAAAEIERARGAGGGARYVVGDLAALPDVGEVDAVVSWGNSFGYLKPEDTARSLMGMRRALAPGGRLVLESATVAESLLVNGLSGGKSYEAGGVRMTTVDRYDPLTSRLESEAVLEAADGRTERTRYAHRVHTTGEVVRMLRAAGFGDVTLLGGDGVAPYAPGSPRMIAVAMR
jgi:SAM-dependent methyltransferase